MLTPVWQIYQFLNDFQVDTELYIDLQPQYPVHEMQHAYTALMWFKQMSAVELESSCEKTGY